MSASFQVLPAHRRRNRSARGRSKRAHHLSPRKMVVRLRPAVHPGLPRAGSRLVPTARGGPSGPSPRAGFPRVRPDGQKVRLGKEAAPSRPGRGRRAQAASTSSTNRATARRLLGVPRGESRAGRVANQSPTAGTERRTRGRGDRATPLSGFSQVCPLLSPHVRDPHLERITLRPRGAADPMELSSGDSRFTAHDLRPKYVCRAARTDLSQARQGGASGTRGSHPAGQ